MLTFQKINDETISNDTGHVWWNRNDQLSVEISMILKIRIKKY